MTVTFTSAPFGPMRTDRRLVRFGLVIALFGVSSLGAIAETAGQSPAPANSQTTSPDAAQRSGRYTMVPAEGGFVRLDTETGSVSHCRRGDAVSGGVWQCAAIPETVLAKPDPQREVSRQLEDLRREVATLRSRIDAIEQRGATNPPSAARPPAQLSGDPEMDKALNFSEELMRRFFGMVREMKRDAEQNGI